MGTPPSATGIAAQLPFVSERTKAYAHVSYVHHDDSQAYEGITAAAQSQLLPKLATALPSLCSVYNDPPSAFGLAAQLPDVGGPIRRTDVLQQNTCSTATVWMGLQTYV